MIADPLRLFDFCMETDYGCAAIVTTAERAADLRQKPAYISGAVMGAPASVRRRADGQLQHARRGLRVVRSTQRRAKSCTGSAGAGPATSTR